MEQAHFHGAPSTQTALNTLLKALGSIVAAVSVEEAIAKPIGGIVLEAIAGIFVVSAVGIFFETVSRIFFKAFSGVFFDTVG